MCETFAILVSILFIGKLHFCEQDREDLYPYTADRDGQQRWFVIAELMLSAPDHSIFLHLTPARLHAST
jgi:hypothetical protein